MLQLSQEGEHEVDQLRLHSNAEALCKEAVRPVLVPAASRQQPLWLEELEVADVESVAQPPAQARNELGETTWAGMGALR
jgi:hypothetical protein